MNEDRTVILARIQSGPGVDAIEPALGLNPSAYVTDAMLVSAADIQLQSTTLERANYNPSLSKDKTGVGRLLQQMTFTHELRASGVFGTPPRVGRLIRACGFAETIIPNTAPATIGTPVGGPYNSVPAQAVAITKGATAPTKNFDTYRIYTVVGGAGAAARFLVVGQGFHEDDGTVLHSTYSNAWTNSKLGTVAVGGTLDAPTYTFGGTFAQFDIIECWVGGLRFHHQVTAGQTPAQIATALAAKMAADARLDDTAAAAAVITVGLSGSAVPINGAAGAVNIPLGASGASVEIPAGYGALVAGDYWDVTLRRPGVRYDPVSDGQSLITLYAYMDGELKRVTDARGTFTMTANAGEYPTLAFTFTGRYNEPVDAAVPTSLVRYEQSKPYKVELAEAAVYGLPNVCAQAFTFDLAQTITPKDCMNAEEALDELRISDRTPTATVNPESVVPSVFSPWTRMRREDTTRLHVMGGRRGGVGNMWRFQADAAQYTSANAANRDKVRANDLQFRLARLTDAGDDEVFFHFS